MEFSVSDLVDVDDGTVKCFFFFCIPSNCILVPAIPHLCQHNILCHFIGKKKKKKRSAPLQMRSVIKTIS